MVERASTTLHTRVAVPWMALPTFWRATVAGVAATFAMTAWIYLTQAAGVSQLEVARALGTLFGIQENVVLIGTAVHVVIGVILGLIYAYGFYELLPGPGWTRGLVYSLLPTTFVGIFMPLVAWGLVFSGAIAFGALAATMWIVNQLVYGLVLGLFYGTK
ncbi:MAG: hypothetical protein HYX94_02420 [Chloroflexi bacterium]|nr:hypothetical protein [Chloroflexota bacterium]